MNLDPIRKLEDGWLNGEGQSYHSKGLYWLEKLSSIFGDDAIAFPMINGLVEVTWGNGATLEVDLISHFGTWNMYYTRFDMEERVVLNLGTEEDKQWLVKKLEMLKGDK